MSTEDKLFSSYLVIQPTLKGNDQYPKQILSIIQKEIVIILNNYNNSFRTKRCQYNHWTSYNMYYKQYQLIQKGNSNTKSL